MTCEAKKCRLFGYYASRCVKRAQAFCHHPTMLRVVHIMLTSIQIFKFFGYSRAEEVLSFIAKNEQYAVTLFSKNYFFAIGTNWQKFSRLLMSFPSTQSASSMQSSPGINQLLGAERKAKQIIEEARKERQSRLRAAKDEANSEINEYKKGCETQIAQLSQGVKGQETNLQHQIEQQTSDVLKRVDHQIATNKEATIMFLIQQVVNIQPELHANYATAARSNAQKGDARYR